MGIAWYMGMKPVSLVPAEEVECVADRARILRTHLKTDVRGHHVGWVQLEVPGSAERVHVFVRLSDAAALAALAPGTHHAVWRQRGARNGCHALDPARVPLRPRTADVWWAAAYDRCRTDRPPSPSVRHRPYHVDRDRHCPPLLRISMPAVKDTKEKKR